MSKLPEINGSTDSVFKVIHEDDKLKIGVRLWIDSMAPMVHKNDSSKVAMQARGGVRVRFEGDPEYIKSVYPKMEWMGGSEKHLSTTMFLTLFYGPRAEDQKKWGVMHVEGTVESLMKSIGGAVNKDDPKWQLVVDELGCDMHKEVKRHLIYSSLTGMFSRFVRFWLYPSHERQLVMNMFWGTVIALCATALWRML